MVDSSLLALLGFILILLGFLVFFAAIFLLFSSSRGDGQKASGGGAIIVGPIPIVFGTDKRAVKTLLILSIILMVIVLVVNILLGYL